LVVFVRHAVPPVLYLLVAIAATWPLTPHLADSLPRGTEPVATVPLFNAWTIWWNCHQISRLYQGYWDAPVFYPTEDAFALSEPMPLTAAGLPVWAGSGNLVLTYNVLLLLALTLNGWSGYCLLRRMRVTTWLALLGGGMLETLAFVFNEFGVFQLVPLFGILGTILALDALARRPTVRRALGLGAWFAVAYGLCTYYGLFLAVALPLPALWLLGRKLLRPRVAALLALSALAAGMLMAPLVVAQWRVTHRHAMARPENLVRELSAHWADFAVAPWKPRLGWEGRTETARIHIRLSPGMFKYALAAVGVAWGVWHRRRRRWAVFLLLFLLAGLLLAMGPHWRIGQVVPYDWVRAAVPGIAEARNVFRFAVFFQIAVTALAAFGLQSLWEMSRHLTRGGAFPAWRPRFAQSNQTSLGAAKMLQGAVVVLAIAAVVELWPWPQSLYQVPSQVKNEQWLDWLRTHTPPHAVIACAPFPTGVTAEAYEPTTVWMYWGAFHQRRMVNGYSGFFPDPFLQLKEAMRTFPDAHSIYALQKMGVRYCVVARDYASQEKILLNPFLSQDVEHIFADDMARIDIYALRALAPEN
jgi:hypothetical protein